MRVFSKKLGLKCREKRIRDMMCGSSHGRVTNSKWGFLERLHRRIVAELAVRGRAVEVFDCRDLEWSAGDIEQHIGRLDRDDEKWMHAPLTDEESAAVDEADNSDGVADQDEE